MQAGQNQPEPNQPGSFWIVKMALAINLAKASYYDDDNDTKLIKICKNMHVADKVQQSNRDEIMVKKKTLSKCSVQDFLFPLAKPCLTEILNRIYGGNIWLQGLTLIFVLQLQ